jgi:hypothetical protein
MYEISSVLVPMPSIMYALWDDYTKHVKEYDMLTYHDLFPIIAHVALIQGTLVGITQLTS